MFFEGFCRGDDENSPSEEETAEISQDFLRFLKDFLKIERKGEWILGLREAAFAQIRSDPWRSP